MSRRFARNGWPRAAEMVAATLTASATPHAEGAYTELDASTAQDVCAMQISAAGAVATAATDTSMLLSLAIGGAGSEIDVVSNVAVGGHQLWNTWWAPLYIPAGTRVSGKIRAEQVSDTYVPLLTFMFGSSIPGWGGYSTAETFGADTANSRGTVLSNTAGTYVEFSASTPNPLRAISIYFGLVDNTASLVTHVVDIGVGAAASEVIIGTWQIETDASETVAKPAGPPWLEVPIPAGSRIAVKKSTTADLSAVVIGWR